MPEVTLNVDAFLYNDEDIDSLVDRGLLSRSFCADCKSLNTQPICKLQFENPLIP